VYVVTGPRPERWVRQTDFSNNEAIGYLADRLARLGVEDALAKAGAEPGAPVRIGAIEFDWQPTLFSDKDFVPGRLGTDYRLDADDRVGADDRLAARKARRQHVEVEGEWSDEDD
jgi:GTP-binding protein